MSLAHNFRSFFRSFNQNFEDVCRCFVVLTILFMGLLLVNFGSILKIEENKVLGKKSRQGIDIKGLVNQASLDISEKNFKEASRQLLIILEFEPDNVYAIAMNRKLASQIFDIESEILKTVKIVEMQPNWREAWIKLADLYEKMGNGKLAAEARGKAQSLKTS